MSKAKQNPTTLSGRRRFLRLAGATAAATALLAPPALATTAESPSVISALFAEWRAAYVPYLAALSEFSRVQEAWFADRDNPEIMAAEQRAEAAKDEIEDAVIDLENRIIEAPAATLADIRCKLRVLAKTIGLGDGDIDDASSWREEVLLRLLADVEGIAGKVVQS
ncbi:MAG TPA: hypothetical protein VKT70_10020 [Stellaceae bacterium]|nr:hypothetical protein [Stellaceae bacterium]